MKRITIGTLLALGLLNAHEINLDRLLNDVEKKTDLSSKTKLENGGVSTIYTRDDLVRMQVKSLKDILKSTYPLGYTENRYGLSDPYFMGTMHPSVSSSMRIFIDNQELSIGLFGSGIVLHGNMELGFIDHVEIYTGNPTYEFSTEPTFILVKLYSKNAQKDTGSKISAQIGNFGDSLFSFYDSAEINKEWSYFAYASRNNDIRQKHTSHNTELSRDIKSTHAFASLYDDNNKILIDVSNQKRDAFIDQSLDATPLRSKMDDYYLHIGYNGKYNNLSYLLSYDKLNSNAAFMDDVAPLAQMGYMFPIASFYADAKSYVLSSELKYSYATDFNKFITGVKYRYKKYEYEVLLRNGIDLPRTGNTTQTIATAFIENQYFLEENSIITTGISASRVQNNYSIQNDNLLMYRLGHTYTTQDFIFKTIHSHVETTLDPYLVNSYYISSGKKDVTKQNLFLESIAYQEKNNKYELMLSLLKTKDQLFPNLQTGLLENYSKTIDMKSIVLMWTYEYNQFDKLYITAEYDRIGDMPVTEATKQYKSTIRNLNTYDKFDIFNELFYSRDDSRDKNFYDYSAGVIYHANEDLSVSLKATNIFGNAQTTTYTRVNPYTFQAEEPLKISPIDRHVMLTLEYLF